jgi:hypothetical protein
MVEPLVLTVGVQDNQVSGDMIPIKIRGYIMKVLVRSVLTLTDF